MVFNDSLGSEHNKLSQDESPGPINVQDEPDKPLLVAPYKKGDFIGQKYEVYGILGAGGFGVVYLVYSHVTKTVYALKTFKDEFLSDNLIRDRFCKECQAWVNLERYPYLVRAAFVEEISGRLYIAMEYIAPDEFGLNSLDGYLKKRPPDLAQSLRWAIQFCHGMEYAYAKGISCHRDIKPANIMIGTDKMIKITDFGLAGVLGSSGSGGTMKLNIKDAGIGLSCMTVGGASFGTPTHMPPEQFTNAAECDQRSDIYGFGIVLYQMATGGKVPFTADPPGADAREAAGRYWKIMEHLHSSSLVPDIDSPLNPIIKRCLMKDPGQRYRNFRELRDSLEPLLTCQTGEMIRPPATKELEAWEWSNKGASLHSLGKDAEAIACYDKALNIDPGYVNAWNNRGISLHRLGKYAEAIVCYDRAIQIDPGDASAWNNKGISLNRLGKYAEAIVCYDRAIQIDPGDASAWNNKGNSLGNSLDSLCKYAEAIACYDRALQIDPRLTFAWISKGTISLNNLGEYMEAVVCFDKALRIDPRNAGAWNNRGVSLNRLSKYAEAVVCFDKVLQIDPGDAAAWTNKGNSLYLLGEYVEAIVCYDRALKIDPGHIMAWNNKGNSLYLLGEYVEAIVCYDRALKIDPGFALAQSNKEIVEKRMGR